MIYEIADLRIEIRSRHPFTAWLCRDYLSADQTSPAQIAAEVTEQEMIAEKAVAPELDDGSLESNCLYRKICVELPRFHRILLHAAVVGYEGKGYAFLGKSGAGKSTHAGLWLRYGKGVKIVNGDKPILKVENGEITAYGTPWQGKEMLGEKGRTPLAALCFIEQSKQNRIRKLSNSETAKRLILQTIYPKEEFAAKKTLELLNAIIEYTPAYLLECDVSENAFQTSFEGLCGKEERV